ncbi:hypothetical protein Verru16b_02790 [Lacunisphaera limnophila]|uniref:3-keto-alpha-glucoside-1,2-lyase/3-keto-2-hydroxy-glucal hydratase domain-containing protein n=1 Tax=Lacunisphaera limnophila TaxID=1838286 RepID=A0A1D8AXT4_9BACT|nr:DUF1080 domain-containing protein [Lacunisphaera limnophila]AOS45703.1 hypothetical protein Verru16b_02790 [Lacunisphaera limnophila]
MNYPRLLLAACALLGATAVAQEKPKITAVERSQGWRFLFDGGSLADWRGYGQNRVPKNWTVLDGWLTSTGGPALVSEEEFKDFELLFDWKADEGGVCEVYLRADEDRAMPEESGLLVELAGGTGMGGNGGLTELWRTITPQPGLWHRSKVTVYGNQVEHWVDGERVLTYMVDTAAWRAAVAASRFKDVRAYGMHREGRIVLSGKNASFRNIKIRPL